MKPLVLVHGFMGGSEQWHLQHPLSDDFDLIAVDLPGFGKNAHLPAIDNITSFAQWVLDHVGAAGVESFHLMGHSMGGMIAQEMVRLSPGSVDKLILYGTGAIGVLPGRFESIETSKQRTLKDGVKATARHISATWFLNGANDPEYEGCAKIACQSAPEALPAGLDAMKNWTGIAGLTNIQSKTLILWGDSDRTYAWPQIEKLWSDIPATNLAVFPNSAHVVHSESPKMFNQTVVQFLMD